MPPPDDPSLLCVLIDASPFHWATWSSSSPDASVPRLLDQLLLLLNAHLALKHRNMIAVFASNHEGCERVFPVEGGASADGMTARETAAFVRER